MQLTEKTQNTPIGAQEIAALLGVERATVDQWRTRGILVEPDWTISGRPAWATSTIVQWADATGRAVRLQGPGAVASNAAEWDTCQECGIRFLFEIYIDNDGIVTEQAADEHGYVVCDACASIEKR